MTTSSAQASVRPFDQGAASAKARDGLPNPYPPGSVEHGNYELGRAHAIRANPALGMPLVTPGPAVSAARRTTSVARAR